MVMVESVVDRLVPALLTTINLTVYTPGGTLAMEAIPAALADALKLLTGVVVEVKVTVPPLEAPIS